MSISAWLCLNTIGGLIALSILLISSEILAQTPEGAGVPQNRPAPEAQADGDTSDSATEQEQFSIPVRLLESPEDPKEVERRQEKERRAEEREQADLEAQRGMAKSAREMLGPAWWQVWIAGIGGVLLGASLIFSAIAARAAIRSADIAQLNLHSNRAWITFVGMAPEVSNIGMIIEGKWQNTGLTPALHCTLHIAWRYVPQGADIPVFPGPETEQAHTITGPRQEIQTGLIGIESPIVNMAITRVGRLFLYSSVSYRDIYETTPLRFSEVCGEYSFEGIDGATKLPRFSFRPTGNQNTGT